MARALSVVSWTLDHFGDAAARYSRLARLQTAESPQVFDLNHR